MLLEGFRTKPKSLVIFQGVLDPLPSNLDPARLCVVLCWFCAFLVSHLTWPICVRPIL